MQGDRQYKGGADGSQPGLQSPIQGGLEFRYVGKGIYEVYPYPTRSMTMTGSAVTLDFDIQFNHRLVKVQWSHAVAAGTDGADATAAYLYQYDPVSGRKVPLYAETASTSSHTVAAFGEEYEYVAKRYQWSFNTTNTDLVYPKMWVQELR